MSRIESLLLASTNPERLRRWYLAAFEAAADVDGFLDLGVSVLIDARDDVADRPVEPGRVILNHHVPSIKDAASRLDELGARWVSPVEYRDAGLWFGTVEDPDGNYVQLIETTPAYWRQKQERAGTSAGPLVEAVASARLPAQDLERARSWYADKLGLEPVDERPGGLRYVCGRSEFVVFASTGKASGDHTQLALTVPDLDMVAERLRKRGVKFGGKVVDVAGHYASTGASGERAIWFTDSEGNLIGLGQYVY